MREEGIAQRTKDQKAKVSTDQKGQSYQRTNKSIIHHIHKQKDQRTERPNEPKLPRKRRIKDEIDRRTRPEGPQEQRPQDQIKQYSKSGWEHGAQAHTAEKQTSSERAGAALEQQTNQARLCTPVGDRCQSSTSDQSKIITKHTNTQACTSLT